MAARGVEVARAEIDTLFADYVALLQELVRQPSPLGDVRSAQAVVYRHLVQLGLHAHMKDIEPEAVTSDPAFAPVSWSASGQPNVWGVLPAASFGGRSLVLNGHIDVVPPGPPDFWHYDPWGAMIAGDRMYGRGTMDMKAGLVAGLLAIEAISRAGIKLRGPVVFESVIEEECTGNGMLAVTPVLGTLIFLYGRAVFLKGGWDELRARTPGMMLLISLAISVAFVASAATFLGLFDLDFWWELALLVTMMLFGHWQEMRAIGQAQGALGTLAALLPDDAECLTDHGVETIPLASLRAGDTVLIRPGARVPADGVIVDGEAELDESMISGDARPVAEAVARDLGIDEVFAEVPPEDKDRAVATLQARGERVAMVGDGVNDAPALARADVGIAIGAGTDAAIESAGVIFTTSDPRAVVGVIELSHASYRKMVQNLAWAAGYNVLAIPLAAGILAPIGIVLAPAVGAILMSVSTIVVALNAQLLRRLDLRPEAVAPKPAAA